MIISNSILLCLIINQLQQATAMHEGIITQHFISSLGMSDLDVGILLCCQHKNQLKFVMMETLMMEMVALQHAHLKLLMAEPQIL